MEMTFLFGRYLSIIYRIFIISLSLACSRCKLLISGFGEIETEKYFVELYSLENITNLQEFSIITANEINLPKTSMTNGTFLLLTNNDQTIAGFFNNAYAHIYGYPDKAYVILRDGDDKIELRHNGVVIDRYGSPGMTKNKCMKPDCMPYNYGWAKRYGHFNGSVVFSQTDWRVYNNTLSGCSINRNCSLPYPTQKHLKGKIGSMQCINPDPYSNYTYK